MQIVPCVFPLLLILLSSPAAANRPADAGEYDDPDRPVVLLQHASALTRRSARGVAEDPPTSGSGTAHADLLPMLAVLKGLYNQSKEHIADLNAKEQQYKKDFEVRQAEHASRVAAIEARYKNGTLSKEFYTNETRDADHMFEYWKKVRDGENKAYHANLNIQHSMMAKMKALIDVYEKTIAGEHVSPEELAKAGAGIPGAGPVVLMQENAHLQESDLHTKSKKIVADIEAAHSKAVAHLSDHIVRMLQGPDVGV